MLASCLCGAINYDIEVADSSVTYCHCSQCRRHTGALAAGFVASHATPAIVNNFMQIHWYATSTVGERGFCPRCGSKLFWRDPGGQRLLPHPGSFAAPDGFHGRRHIFVESKGGYYDILDELPTFEKEAEHPLAPPPKHHYSAQNRRTAHCQCGKVRMDITGPVRPVVYCHCRQCAHWHGHYPGYSSVSSSQVTIQGEECIAWYHSSPEARRGFCRDCGSSLFWQRKDSDQLSILANAFDEPVGLVEGWHIFVGDKAGYYQIHDDLPQFPAGTPADFLETHGL